MQIIRNLSIITIATLVLAFSWCSPAFSSGTVTVEKSSDEETIRIIGDDEDNSIEIWQSGDYLIIDGNDGTTVTVSDVDMDGVSQIKVRMKGGGDTVSIGEPVDPPSTSVDTPDIDWIVKGNAGQDFIAVVSFRARSLTINGGGGNDFIGLDTLWVEEQSGADGGSGNRDEFHIIDLLWEQIEGPFDLSQFELIIVGCFRGDTLVATETGLRPIRTISKGDHVWSWDEASGTKVLRKVSRTMRKPAYGLRELKVGNETIYTTDGHPYWVEGKGWVKVHNLNIGDTLRAENGTRLVVLSNDRVDSKTFYAGYDITQDYGPLFSIKQKKGLRLASHQPSNPLRMDGVVYNLEVEDTHTFFVGKQKVLVHNK